MDRKQQLADLAVSLGRSRYFLFRQANALADLDRADLADQLTKALIQVMQVELDVLKLAGQRFAAPAEEQLTRQLEHDVPF